MKFQAKPRKLVSAKKDLLDQKEVRSILKPQQQWNNSFARLRNSYFLSQLAR